MAKRPYVQLNSLVPKGYAIKEYGEDDLPAWAIPIRWKKPEVAQKKELPLLFEPKRAFALVTGHRLTAWEIPTNADAWRLYTVDKMGKRGCKPFTSIVAALRFVNIEV